MWGLQGPGTPPLLLPMDNAEKEGSSFAAQHRESTYPCPSPRENKRLFQSPRHSCGEDAAGHGDNTLSPPRQPDAFPCSLTYLEFCLGNGSPALGVFRSQSHFCRVLRPTGVPLICTPGGVMGCHVGSETSVSVPPVSAGPFLFPLPTSHGKASFEFCFSS